MKLIMLGPPNSGKGTYSQRLSPILNIPQISTGDLFREQIKNQAKLGKKANKYVSKGQLVPDNITIEMLKQRISQKDCRDGFILDGFPRTIPQAQSLDKLTKIDFVINIIVPEEILIKRATSRISCINCGKIYNLLFLKPKQEGVCDDCSRELYQRKDDTEEVFKDRLKVYEQQTKPLIDYYKKKRILKNIINDKIDTPPEVIVEKIIKAIK